MVWPFKTPFYTTFQLVRIVTVEKVKSKKEKGKSLPTDFQVIKKMIWLLYF